MTQLNIQRGDIWEVHLPDTSGISSPALVISRDEVNNGPADILIVIPCTENVTIIPTHIQVEPNESGYNKTIYIKSEQVKTILKERLGNKLGSIQSRTLSKVTFALRILLDM